MMNEMIPKPHDILRIVRETSAEYTFRVAYEGVVNHGQFFQLSIPKLGEAPISVSGAGDGYVEFTIRKIGRLTNGIFGLHPGDVLFMRGPYGNGFPIEAYKGKHLVIITGGTGLAPVKTLLHHVIEHKDTFGEVYLLSGFKNEKSVLFKEELQMFKEHFHTIYTLDEENANGFKCGFITNYIHHIPFHMLHEYSVVVVGPPAMMNQVGKECEKLGVPEDKIWMSFERKMSCAVGKCGHCKINETYVCLDGPVFSYTKAKKMFD